MSIENFNEIQAYLEANKDNNAVKSYIGGFVTPDRVEAFLQTDDGKKLLQPKLDSYHTKGLKTWQDKNLNSLVDAEVKKRYPEADPKDTELANMKAEIEQMKKDTLKKELINKALKFATEKNLPADLVDYFIGDNEENTTKNLEKFNEVFSGKVENLVQERLKGTYKPPVPQSIGVDALQVQYQEAVKAGNTALAISIKNKIFEQQRK